jgi:two-component system, OmpR family, response regulator MprA
LDRVSQNILVVDDDDELRAVLRRGLEMEGFQVLLAANGQQAAQRVDDHQVDLVVLDIVMPGPDGLEICRQLRAADERLPIIMLTARDTVPDRVAGLEMGADDYLIKPFAFVELLARIRVRLRQRERRGEGTLRFADLSLDTASREAWRGERRLTLTATEYSLLRLFLQHPRQVLLRSVIYERVWGYEFEGESKIIDVYVGYLRNKLEARGEPRLIHTMRGVGYVLKEVD